MSIKKLFFGNLDFNTLFCKRDFKEADVRAVIIDPLLKELGFTQENILREKSLQNPFLITGSKKRRVRLIPDYVLKVKNGVSWVLESKKPREKILDNDNIEQAYS